jgi:hypothetical protein
MAWLLHELPGRVRVLELAIKAHPARAAALAADLRKVPGVIRASANAVTGSVVVEYKGTRGAVLRALGVETEAVRAASPPSALSGPIEKLATSVAERLLEHALRAAVTALM